MEQCNPEVGSWDMSNVVDVRCVGVGYWTWLWILGKYTTQTTRPTTTTTIAAATHRAEP